MSKHTQEPWPPFTDIAEPATPHPDSDRVVRLDFNDYSRARACVNACAVMETEHLENQAMLGETLLDRFRLVKSEAGELTKQRDELLDAICGLIDFIEIDEIKIDSLALSIAREAIAKAKGGAA